MIVQPGNRVLAVCASSLSLVLAGCSRGSSAPELKPLPILGVTQEKAPAESKRVALVINQISSDSVEIGRYYAEKRKIPRGNIVVISVPTADNIDLKAFESQIRDKIKAGIAGAKNTIDFIVLTKGVPIRIGNDGGYSTDAHIAAMNLPFKPMEGLTADQVKRALNPYFAKNEPFSSKKFGFYLVTRLDGYSVDHAKALVDNSLKAKAEKGLFFFDAASNRTDGGYGRMQMSLMNAGKVMKARGFEATVDSGAEFVAPSEELSGYASWGSNDGQFNMVAYRSLRFKPGALAETFVSTSGRTFRRTQGGQSLIADLIEDGVTGVKGYVSEPFTLALAEPDILFDRYTRGFNLAESFYMASRLLKWKDVVIGDPLCSPYPKR